MNNVQKAFRRGCMLLSQTVVPKGLRKIRNVRLKDFELLAFVNEDVGRQMWLFKSFEPDETRFFSDVVKPGDVCLDVGGNVGFFAMLMAKRAGLGAVHVFEPIPLNAVMIKANALLNGFENVTINNVAVGSEEGIAKFSISTDSAYSSMIPTDRYAEAISIEVPLISLDRYTERSKISRVDIMKVDVEGAEDMVLIGGSALLSDPARRPRMVLLELYDENLIPFGTSVGAIVDRMIAFGYSANVLSHGGRRLMPYQSEMANKYYNIIFTPA